MTTDTDPQELETVEDDHAIRMGEDLAELKANPAFKRLILDGYLKENALAKVSLLGVPSQRPDRVNLYEELIAVSNLQFFFSMVEGFYTAAKDPVLSDEEEAELEAEQNDNGVK